MDDWLVFRFVLFFALLFLSACFSGAEVAFFSLTPVQAEILGEKRGKAGKLVTELLSKPNRLLVTIYMGNEFVNVAIAAVSTMLALHYFQYMGVAVAVGLGTFMLLVFGEITPKTFALKHAENFSLWAARPLYVFSKLIRPFVSSVAWMTDSLLSAAGGSVSEDKTQITEEELKTLLKNGELKGVIEAGEKEMIFNVFELGDTPVTEVMTPRTEIFGLPVEEGLSGMLSRAVLSNYSRIPVYRKNLDHIIGVLYTKDLLKPGLEKELTKVEEILRTVYFIPATKKVDELLRDFRRRRTHMAIILDEYGGVEGLVTLEDILEAVVGEQADLKVAQEVVELEPGRYQVPARLALEDFNAYFAKTLDMEDTHTIGGLVFNLFGRLPRWGESVTHKKITFTVSKLKRQMIWQLSVMVDEKEMQKEKKPEKET